MAIRRAFSGLLDRLRGSARGLAVAPRLAIADESGLSLAEDLAMVHHAVLEVRELAYSAAQFIGQVARRDDVLEQPGQLVFVELLSLMQCQLDVIGACNRATCVATRAEQVAPLS